MQSVYLLLENIGRVDTSVLITGASGTGKELAVHALHQESPRRNRPLIMVDCTAMTDTLLESELFGHIKKGLSLEPKKTGWEEFSRQMVAPYFLMKSAISP